MSISRKVRPIRKLDASAATFFSDEEGGDGKTQEAKTHHGGRSGAVVGEIAEVGEDRGGAESDDRLADGGENVCPDQAVLNRHGRRFETVFHQRDFIAPADRSFGLPDREDVLNREGGNIGRLKIVFSHPSGVVFHGDLGIGGIAVDSKLQTSHIWIRLPWI